ncbi:MAG: IS21-like element helper ATPase IstB [Legionella sp.]|uniref:IS21-like element helper ATPase IstB n=1 Tax=Legionella sp. TaxID=459 RepID=UPI0039E4949C
MLNNHTLQKLRLLRLNGMADALQDQIEKPLIDLDFESRVGFLVDREWLLRENRRVARRLQQAKLQQPACIEDINYEKSRGLVKAKIIELSQNQWITQHLNLLITGPTGCGKTYLACAIAHRACLEGFTSRYYRLPRLWEELKIARASGTYNNLLSQLAKIDLLILDDWGLISPDIEQRRDILEILDDRYQQKSTIITSQLPTTHWHEYLNDATLADAILDRLIHNSIKLELMGESMRKYQKDLQKEKK